MAFLAEHCRFNKKTECDTLADVIRQTSQSTWRKCRRRGIQPSSFRTVMEKRHVQGDIDMLIHKTMVKHMIIVKIRLSRLFCGIM